MIHVEGQKCMKYRTVRVTRKRAVQLSLYLDQQKASKRIETVRRSEQAPLSAFERLKPRERTVKKGKYTPDSRSVPMTPKPLSKTSTPLQRKQRQITNFSVEFKPPTEMKWMKVIKGATRTSESTERNVKRSIWGSSELDSSVKSRRVSIGLENKITMKDLQVTLPEVIKAKKTSRRLHRYSHFF